MDAAFGLEPKSIGSEPIIIKPLYDAAISNWRKVAMPPSIPFTGPDAFQASCRTVYINLPKMVGTQGVKP